MTTYQELLAALRQLLAALRQLLAAPDLHLEELDPRTVAAIQRAERAIRNADKSREG